ncbi:MAG: DUF2279 domain-containing protein [Candidatus Edwardsbacteria bacterium]|nr:DUF2279 domain-containing protein [Candidatus Edwardsbacteria bacterium]
MLAAATSAATLPDTGRTADCHNDCWLARDKAAHFALSCALVGFGHHLATRESGFNRQSARRAVVSITLSLGIAKELWDGTKKDNHFSRKDLAADILGAACGALLFTRK